MKHKDYETTAAQLETLKSRIEMGVDLEQVLPEIKKINDIKDLSLKV